MSGLALAALLAIPLATTAVDAKKIYLENCATCHGEDGKADTELGRKYMAQDFTEPKLATELTAAKARKIIRRGVPGTKMKPWKGELKSEEIDAVADYVVGTFIKK
jgi:mono/diheme cytochrome c family protein